MRSTTDRHTRRMLHGLGASTVCTLLLSTRSITMAAPEAVVAEAAPAISLRQASMHPMRYHVSLPVGWKSGATWPIVVVIPDASREFAANLRRFVLARGERPFILVAPQVLSCGGSRSRTRDHYAYSAAEWARFAEPEDVAFDAAGIAAVLSDVRRQWGGEPKAFLTGWEAGGHTVWAETFLHPERWNAVAPVTPNYQGRGLTDSTFSTAPERADLPIRQFNCGAPPGDGQIAMRYIEQQTQRAFSDARAHGFARVQLEVVPGADHGPLEQSVLTWFASLLGSRKGH